jgi:transcriptional regulator with XRE-family HTH domain
VRPEAQIFGKRLRDLRVQRGLSQAALAEAVSDLERGLKAPTLTMILKLSRALEVSASDLLADFSPERVRRLRLE